MTAAAIRQSFLNFFREKQHSIVPSASLLPQSPGLLFTNAGMNPFVPYFLGVAKAPFNPPRATDTQKCIRAGGKHNDLEDVGYDTYHHTFFEMLGNWSFGNYFKQEAIAWAWELVVERWGLPANRLYASVYGPKPGDPGEFDQESWDIWAALFRAKGCDPAIHIVHGSVKDNFWMMGETGPCGPCSELHVDLTPDGDSQGKLVNNDSDLCIEIWNLVFIQYNAEADGSFRELPAKHVDTGMGFERACSIIQNTKGFTDFSVKPSNYSTDVFQPLFRQLEALSGKTYTDTYPLPGADRALFAEDLKTAIAFRVIADHLRTLSFSIADGILPGNTGRNYVLRRILRRAVRYGRQLGFSGDKPFFGALVATLVAQMGEVFPELLARQDAIRSTLEQEEASFNQTLDRGLKRFEEALGNASVGSASVGSVSVGNASVGSVSVGSVSVGSAGILPADSGILPESSEKTAALSQGALYSKPHGLPHFERPWGKYLLTVTTRQRHILAPNARQITLDAIQHFHGSRYILFAAVVMPDHFHLLIEPQPKEYDAEGHPIFWELGGLMHSIKSFTAKEINTAEGATGTVWERDYHDRLIRSDADFGEKFDYITTNAQRADLTKDGPYPFVWSRGWSETSLAEMRLGSAGVPPADSGILPESSEKPAAGAPSKAAALSQNALPTDSSAAQFPQSHGQDAHDSRRDAGAPQQPAGAPQQLSGDLAFELYDTFGFPVDLTELLCAERGLTVDMPRFEKLMEQQRDRARAAKKSTIVRALDVSSEAVTEFVGFECDEVAASVLEIHPQEDALFIITDKTVFYAEMGGQSGDTGSLVIGDVEVPITGVQQIGKARAHIVSSSAAVKLGDAVTLKLDARRRRPIEAHHTATHLLHWALHEVVSPDAAQQGSAVDENRLRFDFNSGAVTAEQVAAMEEQVNAAIQADVPVSWTEVPHASIKGRADIMQFFGDKYGETVRVVQVGGDPSKLNGYSMELCGGTHVRRTSEIGLFKIKSEGAIASGVRRIEAVCGEAAWNHLNEMVEKWDHELKAATAKLHAANEKLAALAEPPVTVHEFPHIMSAMLVERADISQLNAIFAHGQRTLGETRDAAIEAEKRLKKIQASQAASLADEALAELIAKGEPIIASFEADASLLQELQNGLKKKNFAGPALLIVDDGDKLHLATHCGSAALAAGLKAGDLLRDLAALAGGKGGGKPDQARGAAHQREQLAEIMATAAGMLKM
ncbi:MAG: alanine--tRNA ligase [Verrucomicrobia bacterium]|nr:MAG: alanine--tRNA ligase [Verrucomicrobiota bacterium]